MGSSKSTAKKSINVYKEILKQVGDDPKLILPNAFAENFSSLCFQKMKDMGMTKLLISKNNIMTKGCTSKFVNDYEIQKSLYDAT